MSATVSQFSARRLLQSGFLWNVATLLTGHSIAMALTLFAAPILGRIYTPLDYGVVGIFTGITSVFATIGNWQYSQAIIIEKSDHRAFSMLPVCILSSFFTTLLSAIPTIVILFVATNGFTTGGEIWWFALIPIHSGATAIVSTFSALANRLKCYRLMSAVRLAAVTVAVTTSIIFGLYGFGSHGLFLGLFADRLIMLSAYLLYARRQLPMVRDSIRFSLLESYALLKRHRRFALFSTPSSFIGNLSMQLPIFVLGLTGQAAWVGVFSRGRQLVTMPVSLAAGSVALVYQQRAAVEYRDHQSCWAVFKKTATMLLGIGFGPTLVLVFAGPDLCEFVLGPNWRAAGEVAQILAPMLLMRFICNPLARTFHVVGAQKDDLCMTLLTAAIVGTCVMVPLTTGASPKSILTGYASGYFLAYLLYVLRAGWLAMPHHKETSAVACHGPNG